MNTDTGEIYRTAEAIEAARKRGEPLRPLSERQASRLEKLPLPQRIEKAMPRRIGKTFRPGATRSG